jgi:hypothetical protein
MKDGLMTEKVVSCTLILRSGEGDFIYISSRDQVYECFR